MISKYNHKELTWIDLESPSEEEIFHIIDEYSIPLYIKEEIILKTTEDRINLDNEYIFASLYFTQVLEDEKIENNLIFVVSNSYILTIHSKPMQTFDIFSKEMELDIITDENNKVNNNKLLFAYLLKSLYVNSQKQLSLNSIQIEKLIIQLRKKAKQIKLYKTLFIISIIVIIILLIILCL